MPNAVLRANGSPLQHPASAYSGHLRASRGWLLLTADAGRESIASAEEGSVCHIDRKSLRFDRMNCEKRSPRS